MNIIDNPAIVLQWLESFSVSYIACHVDDRIINIKSEYAWVILINSSF